MIQTLNKQADVLLITAMWDELQPLIEEFEEHKGNWEYLQSSSDYPYYFKSLTSHSGTKFTLAATNAPLMGKEMASIISMSLISDLKPSFLVMSGICAGLKDKVSLGDIIVADVVFNYEYGKLETKKDGTEDFYFDLRQSELNPKIKPLVENFKSNWYSPLIDKKTPPLSIQEQWVIEKFFKNKSITIQEIMSDPEFDLKCPNWTEVLTRLRAKDKKLVNQKSLSLTKKGDAFYNKLIEYHPKGFKSPPFKIHIEPIASGDRVVEDENVFKRLKKVSRKVLGLDM